MDVSAFIAKNFLHFNAHTLKKAADAYAELISHCGKMVVCLGGAMSTAQIGVSLAKMIRQDKVHAICCTGANLEEDLFNLIGHSRYAHLEWRNISAARELDMLAMSLNRITDTAIPEQIMVMVEEALLAQWKLADKCIERCLPHEFFYRVLDNESLADHYEDPEDSWLLAAHEKSVPLWVPGWEDSSMGNIFAARLIDKTLKHPDIVLSGIHYMLDLEEWYKENADKPLGYFQIGGGIAGDFAICVVPMLRQDLNTPVPHWAYFCQISDSVTSYGSYSGAPPNEKLTWDKLGEQTPRFMIESDATICVPLIFAMVLGL